MNPILGKMWRMITMSEEVLDILWIQIKSNFLTLKKWIDNGVSRIIFRQKKWTFNFWILHNFYYIMKKITLSCFIIGYEFIIYISEQVKFMKELRFLRRQFLGSLKVAEYYLFYS